MSFSGWKECTLGDVCALGDGAHTKVKRMESGIPYLTSKNIKSGYIDLGNISYMDKGDYDRLFGESQKSVRHLQKDDVLVGIIGTLGNCYLYKENDEFGISSSIGIIRPNKKVLYPKYLYYIINSNRFLSLIQNFKGGSVQAYTNLPTLRNVPIILPPIAEQEYIANILSTLDQKIETNNQINKKLEEMAQTIFKQWFVDFEFPNEDGESYKINGGDMVESELGMIPKGWKVKSLVGIADYLNGLAMQKFRPSDKEEKLPVLKIKELRQGFADVNSDVCSNIIAKQYIIDDGDIIFSWSGSLLVDIWCGGKCGLNQHLFKITSSKYEKWFYFHWTKYHLDKFIRIAGDKATTMGHIKRTDLASSLVVVPDEEVFNKANKVLRPLLDKIIKTRIESRKLQEIRDNLLPKLMSGVIRVPLDN